MARLTLSIMPIVNGHRDHANFSAGPVDTDSSLEVGERIVHCLRGLVEDGCVLGEDLITLDIKVY